MAEIMAYQGRYQDAARLYTQSGAVDKAMEMFSDLRQFDEAKKWAEEYGRTRGENAQVTELINKQAEWSEEVKNYDAAAEMYIKVGGLGGSLSLRRDNHPSFPTGQEIRPCHRHPGPSLMVGQADPCSESGGQDGLKMSGDVRRAL